MGRRLAGVVASSRHSEEGREKMLVLPVPWNSMTAPKNSDGMETKKACSVGRHGGDLEVGQEVSKLAGGGGPRRAHVRAHVRESEKERERLQRCLSSTSGPEMSMMARRRRRRRRRLQRRALVTHGPMAMSGGFGEREFDEERERESSEMWMGFWGWWRRLTSVLPLGIMHGEDDFVGSGVIGIG